MTIAGMAGQLASAERLLATAMDEKDSTKAREAIGKAYQVVHLVLSELKPNLAIDSDLKTAYADLKKAYAFCFDGYRFEAKTKQSAVKAKKWVAVAITRIVRAYKTISAKKAAA